ncbi:MAG: ACP S-malonyltransferase, partial [Chlamydiota bacterium]
MDKGLALIFPGQGAQYVGMGKDFFDTYPTARFVFQEADEILGTYLSKTIFEGPEEELTRTENSQPGIFVVSMAILRVVKEQFPHLKPRMAGGLSLGEYSALCAAEVFSFEEALKLVAARAQYMNEACEQKKGTMAVILGLAPEAVEDISLENLWVANYNCPGQIVISGSHSAIEKASTIAKEKGAKRVLPLSVQGAFHSGYMESAEKLLKERIEETLFCTPRLEVAMNVPGTFV